MRTPTIYECITGHWCGEFAALTAERNCPLCGRHVTRPTTDPDVIDDSADEPVIVRDGAVKDFDPNAITK